MPGFLWVLLLLIGAVAYLTVTLHTEDHTDD